MSHSEQAQTQMEMQAEQGNLEQSRMQAPDYSDRREYLEAVIEDELDDAAVGMLRNMTSRDFILSNLKDPEINEIKKLREITIKKVKAAHPGENAIMQGDLRKQVYDNGEKLTPLTSNQRILIDQYVRAAFADLARSRGGFQQEQFGKTISASEIKDRDSDDGGLLSFS
jgi:hypothetical protein